MSADNQSGWQDYWKSDCAASCEPENPATARQIAALWQGWFAAVPDGSRILDIATGNGIVLAHAAAAARAAGRRFLLTGIDQADIDPPRYLRNFDPDLRSATFVARTPAEALPFAARSFDVVVSQFGLEYADLDRALDEVTRVLAAGGALIWLAHGADSAIVRQHRQQAQELDYLLASGGPIEAMHRYVAALDGGPGPAALNACLAEGAAFCRANPPGNIVREILGGFAALVGRDPPPRADALAAPLAEAERRLRDHRARIRSLLAAVLTPERLGLVRARLEAPPWTDLAIEAVRVGTDDSPIGPCLRARLAAIPSRH